MDDPAIVDAEAMLTHVGSMGRYQYILMVLFCFINVISAFHYFGQIFINVQPPKYTCKIHSADDANLINYTSCTRRFFLGDEVRESQCTSWNYSTYHGYESIVQQLNWICDNDWIPAFGQSIFFTGSVVGSLGFGFLADRIGRLHVLVIANMTALVGNLLTIVSSNAIVFFVSRFIAGCATDANFVMMYIIVMEYIKPEMRTIGLNLCIGVFYCLSCTAVPWIAVAAKSWRAFLTIVSAPHIFVLGFYFLVPESAQWLLSKGKSDTAVSCYTRIAKINKNKIDQKAVDGLKNYARIHIASQKGNQENILGLLKTPKLRKKTLILAFKSMVMTLCYDAISRNVNGLGYSPFVVFSVTSTTILPACAFILLTQDQLGRKALASSALLVSGVFTASSGLILATISSPSPSLIITLAIIARLSINVAYNSGAQYAVELIPTVVRGQGVSVIHVVGYAASFFSPQVLYLGNFWKPTPDLILGSLLILGAFACLFLPETLHRVLPITLKDGEEFGEDERIFDFACCSKVTESTTNLHPERARELYTS